MEKKGVRLEMGKKNLIKGVAQAQGSGDGDSRRKILEV